jgi:PAS domain S-box-containing protein
MENNKNSTVQFQIKKLKEILFGLGDLVLVVDKNFVISEYFQNRDNELLFTPPSLFLGKHLSEIGLSDNDLRQFILSINDSKSGGRTPEFEFKLQIEGKEEFYLASASSLKDETGQLLETYFIANNITQKKKFEIRLQELALIGEKTTDLTIITDPSCLIVWVNPAFEEHTGYKLAEVKGKDPATFLHGPETNPITIAKVESAIKNRVLVQDSIINYTKSGKKYWVDFRIDPVFDEVGMCSHFISIERDITKRKQFEEELATTRLHLLETNRVGKVGGWSYDVVNDKVYWTDVTREIHELSEDFEPTVEKVIQFYKEGESRQKYFDVGTNAIKNGIPYDVELQIITAKGKEVWIRAIGKVDMKGGVCTRLYGTFQDINSFKRVEKELLETVNLLKNLTDHVPACLYQYELNTDFSFTLPFVSEGIFELAEVTSEEVKNKPSLIFEMIHPEDLPKVQTSIAKSFQNLEKWTCDYRILTQTKKEKWIRSISNPQKFGDFVKWYGFLSVISPEEVRH